MTSDSALEDAARAESPDEQSENKGAWTPGPWCVVSETAIWTGDDDWRGVPLALCDLMPRTWAKEIPYAEHQANARLIASSPLLVEALGDCTRSLESLNEEAFGPILDGHGEMRGWVRDELLAKARAALAAARGETTGRVPFSNSALLTRP